MSVAHKGHRWPLLQIAISQTLGYAGLYYSFSALLPTWESVLGWEKAVISFGLTIALVMAAITSPFIGKKIDSGRALPWMPMGMLMGATALLFLPFVQDPLLFYLIWALVGVAQGSSLYDPTFSVITREMGQSSTKAITSITLVAGFASTIAYPLAHVLDQNFGWSVAVWVFSAALATLAMPFLFFGIRGLTKLQIPKVPMEKAIPKDQPSSAIPLKERLLQGKFLILVVAFPLVGLSEAMVITHILPILREFGISETISVLAAGAFGPMQVSGRLFFFRVGPFSNPLPLSVISFSGIVVSLFLLPHVAAAFLLPFVFSVVFGASFGLVSILKPVVLSLVMGRGQFGLLNGFLAVPMLLSFALAPFLASLLHEVGGYKLVVFVGVLSAGLALALMVGLFFNTPFPIPAKHKTN